MKRFDSTAKVEAIVYLVLILPIMSGTLNITTGSTFFYLAKEESLVISSPFVTLQNASNSIIYTNKTSAKVTVFGDTDSLDVLRICNQTNENWKLQLVKFNDSDINRLVNCTIWFHDGSSSSQIKVINGNYFQTSGDLYDCTFNSTRITITASTNATGISYIYTHLKILKPSTSTFASYVITFEIE